MITTIKQFKESFGLKLNDDIPELNDLEYKVMAFIESLRVKGFIRRKIGRHHVDIEAVKYITKKFNLSEEEAKKIIYKIAGFHTN